MQFANDGDLYHKISENKKKKKYFDENYIWKTVIHILRGLKQLHDLKIFHRDIKVQLVSFRLPMCSWILMEWLNWGIWMFQRSQRMDYSTLRRGRHIMRVLKCGASSHMTLSLIFGRWVAWSMKWQRLMSLLKQKTWKDLQAPSS